jgi:phosphatidylglycerophosphatase A
MAEGVQRRPTSMDRTGAWPSRNAVGRALVTFIATGGLVGYAPVVPGTFGSLIGLLLVRFGLYSLWRHTPAGFLTLFGLAFVASCGVADCAERIFVEPDCSAIIIDEILGMIATMFGNPISWPWLLTGFALFRLFDIIKPWPASWFDRRSGGVGVMTDDLASAFYANVSLRVLWRTM